ncbi:MAG: hypothetical protein NTX50_31055, partial [Candidatus Sumerlaeota bacterium]|nr:hypothetical protein [Candidatus Sumerlaeota bacterium]
LPDAVVTDASGNYSGTVSSGWSGTVTPSKSGYTFTPASRPYSNVISNQTSQNYTAAIITYTISGQVTLNSSALSGVNMGGLPGTVVTNSSGNYSGTVNYGWSGTITPSLSGYTFTPSSRTYSNVISNQASQNYTAAPVVVAYTISGQITLNGSGFPGVNMGGMPGTVVTDTSGNYSGTVFPGWSGTVTPSLIGYIFSPASLTYSNVSSDQTAQDYAATIKTVSISGTILSSAGNATKAAGAGMLVQIMPESLRISPAYITLSDYGQFKLSNIPYGSSVCVFPTHAFRCVTPCYKRYNNLTQDKTDAYFYRIGNVRMISGYVWDTHGAGITAHLVATNFIYTRLWQETDTATAGFYAMLVPCGRNVEIQSKATGYSFSPIDFRRIAQNKSLNFTGTAKSVLPGGVPPEVSRRDLTMPIDPLAYYDITYRGNGKAFVSENGINITGESSIGSLMIRKKRGINIPSNAIIPAIVAEGSISKLYTEATIEKLIVADKLQDAFAKGCYIANIEAAEIGYIRMSDQDGDGARTNIQSLNSSDMKARVTLIGVNLENLDTPFQEVKTSIEDNFSTARISIKDNSLNEE